MQNSKSYTNQNQAQTQPQSQQIQVEQEVQEVPVKNNLKKKKEKIQAVPEIVQPVVFQEVPKIRKEPRSYPKEGEYRIEDISYPKKITNPKICKKFFVRLRWTDLQKNKAHSKIIRFGDKAVQDFVEHQNAKQKMVTIARMKNMDNPFRGSLYRLLLLNGPSVVLSENYVQLLDGFGIDTKCIANA